MGFGRQHGVPIFCNQWGVKVDFSLHHLTQPPHHLAATSLPPRYHLFTSPPPVLPSTPLHLSASPLSAQGEVFAFNGRYRYAKAMLDTFTEFRVS